MADEHHSFRCRFGSSVWIVVRCARAASLDPMVVRKTKAQPKRAPVKRQTAAEERALAKAKATSAATTLEKDEIEGQQLTNEGGRRVLRRRSSAQTVSKLLKDHFGGFGHRETDDKVNEKVDSKKRKSGTPTDETSGKNIVDRYFAGKTKA